MAETQQSVDDKKQTNMQYHTVEGGGVAARVLASQPATQTQNAMASPKMPTIETTMFARVWTAEADPQRRSSRKDDPEEWGRREGSWWEQIDVEENDHSRLRTIVGTRDFALAAVAAPPPSGSKFQRSLGKDVTDDATILVASSSRISRGFVIQTGFLRFFFFLGFFTRCMGFFLGFLECMGISFVVFCFDNF